MDSFGSKVHAALIRARKRGVQIYLLVDTVGSKDFSEEDESSLLEVGVNFYRFNNINVRWLFQWGRRLHHKILLIDYQKAIVGGINVTTSGYGNDQVAQQLDFAVYFEGPAVFDLNRYCQLIFKHSCRKNRKVITELNQYSPLKARRAPFESGLNLKVSINDWVYRRWQITQQYARMTKIAKKEITIVNSYFFPRRKFMRRLVQAAKRGVRVRLILPKVSDWPSYILASQYLYAYFLKNNIEIYQWKKSVLHGKLATVDGRFSTIGSFNLNYTSYQQNLEMNVDVHSEEFTSRLNESIEEIIVSGCEKIDANIFIEKATLKTKFLRFFYYIMLAMIANFSISLTYQEELHGMKRNKYLSLFRIVAALFFFILGLIGAILPVIPGFPFFIISFLLVYRQLLFNKTISH
jgi:cardiolipin synthase A/B